MLGAPPGTLERPAADGNAGSGGDRVEAAQHATRRWKNDEKKLVVALQPLRKPLSDRSVGGCTGEKIGEVYSSPTVENGELGPCAAQRQPGVGQMQSGWVALQECTRVLLGTGLLAHQCRLLKRLGEESWAKRTR